GGAKVGDGGVRVGRTAMRLAERVADRVRVSPCGAGSPVAVVAARTAAPMSARSTGTAGPGGTMGTAGPGRPGRPGRPRGPGRPGRPGGPGGPAGGVHAPTARRVPLSASLPDPATTTAGAAAAGVA